MATNNSVNTPLSGTTGSGKFVGDTSPTLVTPALGTPTSGTLSSCTGLSLTTGVTGTLPVANGGTGVTTSTGTGSVVLNTSPTLTGITSDKITWSDTTKGIVGTTTNDSAGAGYVGEVISSTATSVNISHATAKNVTSISLTAGDWDVFGSVLANPPAAQTLSYTAGAINTTSATLPGQEYYVNVSQVACNEIGLAVTTRRISIASTTTVYLVIQSGFSGATGTGTAYGSIMARRAR